MSGGAMRHVHKITKADGRVFLYLRKAGLPRVALKSEWSESADSDLAREVEALVKAMSPDTAIPGTIKAATRAYEQSADWRRLAQSTQDIYRIYLKEFDADMGALPITAFTPGFVLKLKNLWAAKGHRAANLRLQVLANVLRPAMIEGLVSANTFELVGQVARPRELAEPHPIWPVEVVEAVFSAALEERRFGVARAVALGRYTGARRGDLATMSRKALQQGRVRFLSGKRRVPVDIPQDPAMTALLARTPAAQPLSAWQATRAAAKRRSVTESLTLVYNMDGQTYTESGLGKAVIDLVKSLHADGRLDADHYDLHGLRHTRGVELALAGCTDAQGAAMMGHSSPSSFAQYRRQADRIRMADDAADKVTALRARDVETDVETGCKLAVNAANDAR